MAATALALRIVDIFVLELDERLGEIILSKASGFALVVAFVYWSGHRLSALGLHRRRVGAAVAIGAGVTVATFVVGGLAQLAALPADGAPVLRAVDPKTGMAGGLVFAAFLIVGNVINSFMEEGLFRGLLLPGLMTRMRFRTANLAQAALFGAWHLVWPVDSYLDGASAAAALAEAGSLLVATVIAGLVYGYLFWRTDSLWAPWTAHLLHNTVLNIVHLGSDGQLQPATVLAVVAVTALPVAALAVAPVANRLGLNKLRATQL